MTSSGVQTMDVAALVRHECAKQMDLEDGTVKDDSAFAADLGCDDLDMVLIVGNVEEELGIQIDAVMADRTRTVGELTDLVRQTLAGIPATEG